MPFFFIVPVWLVFVVVGVASLFVKKLRWLATYVLCCSTGGLVLSFLMSLAFLMGTGKLFAGTNYGWVSLLAYLGGLGVGGIVGVLLGVVVSIWVNRRLGFQAEQRLEAIKGN